MNKSFLLLRAFQTGILIVILGLTAVGSAPGADTTASKTTPTVGGATNAPTHALSSPTTNAAPSAATNAAANPDPAKAKPGLTITYTDDDDDDSTSGGKSHAAGHEHSIFYELVDMAIPLAGIIATFATPILIVFFVCYFKYRRRRENLALAREYLVKGLPVPPQLLDDSQRELLVNALGTVSRSNNDLRKGLKLTFIGLAVALALYVNGPHSTTWGWGMIPAVMGLGYIISGALQTRLDKDKGTPPINPPPPPNEPPR